MRNETNICRNFFRAARYLDRVFIEFFSSNYLFRLYKDSLQTFFETLCTCVEIFRLEERRKGKGNKIVDIKAYSIE